MKRSEFINRFKRLRANTGLHGNCGDINRVFFEDVLEVFGYVFSATTVFDNCVSVEYRRDSFWLRHGLEDYEELFCCEIETQRIINFELFYHYVLSEKLYKEF